MSDAVWIAIMSLVAAMIMSPLLAQWYKRRQRRRQNVVAPVSVTAPPPALAVRPAESSSPEAPPERPAELNTPQAAPEEPATPLEEPATSVEEPATSVEEKDAEGYPYYMRLPEIAAGPRVLLPYDTPTALKHDVREASPPSPTRRAHDAFVGRWVRFQNGVVRGVREGIECYVVIIAHERERAEDDHVVLTLPRSRRAELERLREGQRITYEGQIRKAEDDILELVRVEIDPASDPSVR